MFETFQRGPSDPMFILKKNADEDTCPEKADLGVGIYRNEDGLYSELKAVKLVCVPWELPMLYSNAKLILE